jgi:DNA-directed RNA polymerase specialized sigma subunit
MKEMKTDLVQQVMPKEEYLDKFKNWYKKCKSSLTDTLFYDNFYENPERLLLQPTIFSESEEKYIWLNYVDYKSEFLFKKLFNHFLVLALYMANIQCIKYSKICDDIESYISFNVERLMYTIKRYNPEMNTSFPTYFINESKFQIRSYLNAFYSNDILTPVVKNNLDAVLYRIEAYNYTIDDVLKLSDLEFKTKFNMSKKNFMKKLNAKIINFTDIEAKYLENGDEDYSFESKIIDESSSYDNIYRIMLERCEKFLRSKPRISKRNIDIWLMYYREYRAYTYDEIGRKYNLTRERIRQILWQLNTKLRNSKEFSGIFVN